MWLYYTVNSLDHKKQSRKKQAQKDQPIRPIEKVFSESIES